MRPSVAGYINSLRPSKSNRLSVYAGRAKRLVGRL
jgi:hypothetical protein